MDDRQRAPKRVGFRKLKGSRWEYFVLPEAWKDELAKGVDPVMLAKALVERKLMRSGSDGKNSVSVSIPENHGKVRVYNILPEILAEPEGRAP